MGILSRAVMAAGAAYAIHKFRSLNADIDLKTEYKNDNTNNRNQAKPFQQTTSTSENTIPDVDVTVEQSSAKH